MSNLIVIKYFVQILGQLSGYDRPKALSLFGLPVYVDHDLSAQWLRVLAIFRLSAVTNLALSSRQDPNLNMDG